MKKTILAILIICFTTAMNAQVMKDSTSNLKIDTNQLAQSYLKKSKSQKTAAWILLSAGAVATTAGVIIAANQVSHMDIFYDSPPPDDATVVLTISGTVAMLTSIPLFIASKKNKRKAHLYLNGGHAMISPNIKMGKFYSVGVRLEL